MKLGFYRLHTGCNKMTIYDPTLSDDYRINYLEKRGKLGMTGSNYNIPEQYHTLDMLAEAYVDETEEDGTFDTNDKEVAKSCLRACSFMSGIRSPRPDEPNAKNVIEENHKKLVAFWDKLLDRSSPRDIIKELEEELKVSRSPKNRKEAKDLAKEKAIKSTK